MRFYSKLVDHAEKSPRAQFQSFFKDDFWNVKLHKMLYEQLKSKKRTHEKFVALSYIYLYSKLRKQNIKFKFSWQH